MGPLVLAILANFLIELSDYGVSIKPTACFDYNAEFVAQASLEEKHMYKMSGPLCDKLTFNERNFDNPNKVAGVKFEDIDAELAINTCINAIKGEPENLRYQYQLGRAYHKDGNKKCTFKFYETSAEKNYPISLNAIAIIYWNEEFGFRNSVDKSFYWFLRAAKAGYLYAQNQVGFMYSKGKGVSRSYIKANKWWKIAADRGYYKSQHNLGLAYLEAEGVEQDFKQATKYFKLAAAQDYPPAIFDLGNSYRYGWGIKKSPPKAVELYIKAGEAGFAEAQNTLGIIYKNATMVKQDFARSIYWFNKAIEQNYRPAIANRAVMYRDGKGEKSHAKAMQLFSQAIAQGSEFAMLHLAYLYSDTTSDFHDAQKAIKLLNDCAKLDYSPCQTELGYKYENGLGVEKSIDTAMYWYEIAAVRGDGTAQNFLGKMQLQKRNYKAALNWFKKSAKTDNPKGLANLGRMYSNGLAVKKSISTARKYFIKAYKAGNYDAAFELGASYTISDYSKSAYWFKKGASHNDSNAMRQLGRLYADGRLGKKDYKKAKYWYEKAGKNHDILSKRFLAQLYIKGGFGLEKNYKNALDLFKQSAISYSINNLSIGYIYMHGGYGVQQNAQQAQKYFKKAIKHRYARGYYELGEMYLYGHGVAKDLEKAKKYYRQALDAGMKPSKKIMNRLKKAGVL